MSRPLPALRRGFTLLEVVIAIAVLTIIAALAWETIGGAMRARDYLSFEEELDRSGRVAMGSTTSLTAAAGSLFCRW